jgi:transcription elongation factor GreB
VSKAFTKEDDLGEINALPPLHSPLRPGERNYLTPAGAQRLREELQFLSEEKRPPLLPLAPTDPEAKRELQTLDQRLAYLRESLRTAEVVPQPSENDRVQFGASVTVRDARGETTTYRLVGVDETDLDRNWVSWQSPIGRALLNTRLGQRVPFKFPAGKTELEIVKIEYR